MIQGSMRHYTNGRKKKYNAWTSTKHEHEFVEMRSIPTPAYRRGGTDHIKSLDSQCGNTTKVKAPVYTGTLVKGISTMHKSNAVPIINESEAKEHANMRR